MILRERIPCRPSASIVLAAGLLLIAATPAWTRAQSTKEKDSASPNPAAETIVEGKSKLDPVVVEGSDPKANPGPTLSAKSITVTGKPSITIVEGSKDKPGSTAVITGESVTITGKPTVNVVEEKAVSANTVFADVVTGKPASSVGIPDPGTVESTTNGKAAKGSTEGLDGNKPARGAHSADSVRASVKEAQAARAQRDQDRKIEREALQRKIAEMRGRGRDDDEDALRASHGRVGREDDEDGGRGRDDDDDSPRLGAMRGRGMMGRSRPSDPAMQTLAGKMEKAFGPEVRQKLVQYYDEVQTLCRSFIPDSATRSKLLTESMEQALKETIPKYGTDSDAEKTFLAEQLRQASANSAFQPGEILAKSRLARTNLALKTTKDLFWANVFPKLNLPAAGGGGSSIDPPKAKVDVTKGEDIASIHKQAEEARRAVAEIKRQLAELKQEPKYFANESTEMLLARQLKSNQEALKSLEQSEKSLDLETKIKAEFTNNPEVAALVSQMEQKKKELARVAKIARTQDDPALKWVKEEIAALEQQYLKRWEQEYGAIHEKLGMKDKVKDKARERRIQAIESTIQKLMDEVKQLREESDEHEEDGVRRPVR